jgi:chromosome segregation ATPase
MAAPEPLEPSQRLRAAAAAERTRLARELARLDERVDLLGQELEQIEARRDAIRRRLSLLARLAHVPVEPGESLERAPVASSARVRQLRDPSRERSLQGGEIREAAVRAALAAGMRSRALHYRDWFELLGRQGLTVAGKRPEATFLTQLGRSPVVRRAGPPGVYAVDPAAPDGLRARIRELRADLARLDDCDLTPRELSDERARRVRLARQLARAERELEEALRVLGEGEGGQ